MTTSPAWGPRPAGPTPPPVQSEQGRSGCLTAFMILLALMGLGMLGEAPAAGVLILAVSGFYLLFVFTEPGRERQRVQGQQERERRQAESWRQSLPETRAVESSDPLRVVRELTAGEGGGVFLGITPTTGSGRPPNASKRSSSLGHLAPVRPVP